MIKTIWKVQILIMLIVVTCLVGCNNQEGEYAAASSISKDGFAENAQRLRELQGQEMKLWGFVDHSNLYGDESTRAILEEWWSGEGPDASTWRFNLKAIADDEAGQSFAIHVPNDEGRDELLRKFLEDARAGKPTKIWIKGKIDTFNAPTEGRTLTGLIMELRSSSDILLELPMEE